MNLLKRITTFILALALIMQIGVPAMAANTNGVTYTATIDQPTLNVSSEDQTITVTVNTNKAVQMDSLYAKVITPNGLKLESISNETLNFGSADYNKNTGIITWSYGYDTDEMNATTSTLAVIKFTVPANLIAGNYVIDFDIYDITADFETWEDGTTVSTTLTIKEAAPTTFSLFGDIEADNLSEGEDLTEILVAFESKDGYTFKGWSFYKDAEKQQSVTLDGNKMPAHDLYVFGNWEENVPEYTLTFLNENGDVLKTYTYKNGWNETPAYPAYSKANHTITWDKQIPATLTGDVEITAIATPNTYVVTFYNGTTEVGTETADQSNDWKVTAIGGKEKEPDANSHYTFKGWGLSDGATNVQYEAGASITVTGKMDLYAVYTAAAHAEGDKKDHLCDECGYGISDCKDENPKDHKCDICGTAMGGECVAAENSHNCGYCDKKLSECSDGDDKNHTCDICGGAVEGEEHTPGTAVEENRKNPTCTTAGSYDSVVYCTECGEKISTTPVTIPATGHTFGDITAKVDATCVAAGNYAYKQCTVCSLYFAADADKDSTAGKADTSSFVIGKLEHIDSDAEGDKDHICENGCGQIADEGCHGGTAYCNAKPVCVECGKEYGAVNPENHASEEIECKNIGYTDVHAEYHKCCNTLITDKAPHNFNNEEHKCVCGDIETVEWTFDFNGGSYYSTLTEKYETSAGIETRFGNEVNVPGFLYSAAPNMTYEGHTQTGWNTAKDGTGTAYPNGKITFNKVAETLYAQWKCTALTYHAAVDATCTTGGTIEYWQCTCGKLYSDAEGTTEVTEITTDKNTSNHTKATAYKNTEGTTHTAYYPCCGKEIKTENHTYVDGKCACDKVATYTIKWVVENKTTEETYTHGNLINLPDEPEKDGYRFMGWEGYEDDMTASENKTFNAKFEKLYTITYLYYDSDADEYKVDDEVECIAGETITLRRHYWNYANTLGWDTNNDGAVDHKYDSQYTMPAEDVTMKPVLAPFCGRVDLGADDATYMDAQGNPITEIHAESIGSNGVTLTTFPVREGYRFTGWKDDAYSSTMHRVWLNEETGEKEVSISFTEDVTLTAQWEKVYTVTFNVNGVEYASAEYAQGETVVAPETPTKEASGCIAYTFAGWNPEIPDTMPAADLTFTGSFSESTVHSGGVKYADNGDGKTHKRMCAVCGETIADQENHTYDAENHKCVCEKVKEFTITFMEGSTTLGTVTAPYGSDITAQVDAMKVKYEKAVPYVTFGHWYEEGDMYATPLNLSTMPGKDMTVKGWGTFRYYNINWIVDGSVHATTTAQYSNPFKVPASPTKTNYTFQHWVDKDGNKLEVNEVGYTEYGYRVVGDSDYTAVFTPNEYTIKFGDTALTANEENNWTVTVPDDPTKTGCSFAGWATTADAASADTNYKAGDKAAFTDSVALYPVFTTNNYTLTIKLGDHGKMNDTSEYTHTGDYGSDVTLPEIVMDEGWKIVSWTANFGGENQTGADLPKTMPAASGTYTAVWDKIDVTVKFNEGETNELTGKYFDKVTAPTLTKEGHTFLGWDDNNNADDTAVLYAGGAEITLDKNVPETLYAKWQINTYTISFANTGDIEMQDKTVAYGESIGTIETPVKEGYTFTGWIITDAEGTEVTVVDGKMPAKNLTYTAGWQIKSYTITWKDADGTTIDTTTVDHGEIPTHAEPTKESSEQYDYKFGGWSPEVVAATNNAEYTATFTSVTRSYDITFVVDGQENKVVSTKYGEKPVYDAEGKAPTKASDNQYSYTFAGWDKELVPVTGEATYTATWTKTPVEYTVTYMIEGETEPYFFRKGGYGTAIDYTGFNNLPTKTGYTFNGWKVGELPSTFAAENVVIYGSYTINRYTITFMDGETEVSKFTDDYGAVITAPEVTKEGHMLTGWKDAQSNSFSTIPAENRTVYAQWQIQSYDVTWQIDDKVYTTTTVEYGAAITAPVPTRDGYEFMGWNVEIPGTMPAEPVTITGSWKPIDYTIIFKVEGMEDQSITAPYGSDITEQVAAITATKEGYQFNCWMTEDNRCANLATMPLGNMTVTADFTINEYNINFFATEGDATALMTFEVEYGTVLNGAEDDPETEEDESKPDVFAELLAQVEAMDDPTKEGHTWKGWDTEDKIPETMPAYAVNIYGIWEVNSYTITADGQVYTFEYGEAVSIPNPTKEGHTFQGWNETVPTTMPAYDVVLTAKWEVNSYTITFDVEGEAYKEITAPYGTEIEWPENPANIPGHTFAGWSTDGVTVIENLPETMPVNGLNLKAVWQKNTVYITWKVEGKQDDVVEYKYGDAITIPADPTKAADAEYTYKFTGWTPEVPETATESKAYTAQFEQDEKVKYDFHFKNDEEVVFEGTIAWGETIDLSAFDAPTKEHNTLSWTLDGAEVTFPYEMPAKEVTFVAQWTPETYTITIDGGEPVTYAYGAAISIENPTKEGHTFQGWKKDGVEGYYTLPETMPAENIVITSDWKVNEYTLSVSSYDAEGKGIQNTVSVPYGTKLAGYYLETPSYTSDGLLHEFQNWVAWTWKNNDDATMVVYTGDTMPASDVKMYPTYTFTGWMTDESGTTYYTKSAKTYFGEWATIDGVKYWFNAEGYIVKDIALIDGGYYAFDHESGKFLDDMTGIYEAVNGDKYYVVDGMAVENKGLVQDRFVLENSEIHTHYYYFGCDATGCTAEACTGAGQFKAQMGVRHWVENNNGMLMKGGYTFGADGVIEHTEDTDRHGIQTVNGVKFYLMDGVKVPYGLFKDRGYYYYARSSGALIVNESYWVSASKLNGLDLKAGTYNFDEEGRIVFGSEKTGIYAENDTLYYYVDGVKTYAGLIQYTGDLNNADGSVTENVYNDSWIYVNTQGEVKNDCKYWISKTNGHMIAMSYTFDVNGIMQDPAVSVGEAKNGVYAEGGSLYYYVNNVRNYAGLIQYTGDLHNADGSVTENVYNDSWIYVNTQGEVKNGCNYWISKNNGYMKNASYNFDENGIMTNPKPIA